MYIATLLNPVDHRLYDIVISASTIVVTNPKPNEVYSEDNYRIEVLGRGGYDPYDEIEYEGQRYFRSHSLPGVAKRGIGLGLMLYSGMSLATVEMLSDAGGIYSVEGDRSTEAEYWWQAQVQNDYVQEEYISKSGEEDVEVLPECIDMCTINCDAEIVDFIPGEVTVSYQLDREMQLLPAANVVDSGFLVAWEGKNLTDLVEESELEGQLPSEILLGFDLSTTTDPNLIINILARLERDESVSNLQLQEFVLRLPDPLKEVDSQFLRELLNQGRFPFTEVEQSVKKQLVANPRVRSDRAWKDFFGKLAEPVDES